MSGISHPFIDRKCVGGGNSEHSTVFPAEVKGSLGHVIA
ncbi:hypothetical protein BTHERMOSOX_1732 [Bathymodiolus thermophilus thioautotrophic gill symbiont]|nr:hypothetical protein BTHERMOSOX_1732 [Bathymodiolus thermophilus thioautotrophic gill symbiont]